MEIVRKNVENLVPKAIMYFLVNHAKRELHKTFVQNLYREDLFDTLLEEQEEVVLKRKHSPELSQVLDKAIQEVESDVSTRCSHSSFDSDDATGISSH